jgi:hypothetical protein
MKIITTLYLDGQKRTDPILDAEADAFVAARQKEGGECEVAEGPPDPAPQDGEG